ncbi:peptide/nickel transport system permease protein [Hydrogenoanaerobacterium saccharovorans]|uniref:Peptide/nickel transport system permease protein n=1 Tax=Hydrogenoanaerobacterium saccharovorans TaxID=474960 RepID=A0A1H7YUA7_9FIRM|nr:ABC transporter permease [Hydrogenoanaerobacterium saccharovorans]RPF49015.1 peptide/nickel transport system permease protein [Hydrogenoanaerobacterium saccharovorans]SEM49543.1 peptide/nickel transport system permease protein [Hydrogenoanaerobacterium saccharovorans]
MHSNTLCYFFKKAAQLIVSLFALSLIVFCISRCAPGDPLKSYYGESVERMSTVQKNAAMEKLGLNKPLSTQYILWLKSSFRGNFGISLKYKQSVTRVIAGVYQNTLLLGGLSYVLTFTLSLLLGIFCCLHEDTLIDRFICKTGTITNSIPSFWISLVLLLVFSVQLGLLPSGGAYAIGEANNLISRIKHLILPLTVMILSHLWYYGYLARNLLLEEIRKGYVPLCKMKGLSRNQIVWRHCLRNMLPSYISIMAISIPHIVGGTYVVEKVFSYPGLGTLCFESAKYHDYNMLMLLCLITGTLVIIGNILAQIINDSINPRMKHDRGYLNVER